MAKSAKVSAAREAGLIVQISGLLPSLSPAEQRVARLVVADPAEAARRTITDLATAAETSEATVIRFCRSVGMEGYPQLRIRLAAEAARRVDPPDARVVGGDIPPGADFAQIIATIAFNDARAVEETAEQLDPAVCERVVEAITDASRVDIYGAGASGFVASDFQQKLHRIGRIAFYWPDVHTALTSAALLGRGDVAIGISHTGTTSDVVEVLEQARSRGATTVALTNFPRSPITEVADHVLTTAARETTYRSGAMASRLAQLTVVDMPVRRGGGPQPGQGPQGAGGHRRGGAAPPDRLLPATHMTAGAVPAGAVALAGEARRRDGATEVVAGPGRVRALLDCGLPRSGRGGSAPAACGVRRSGPGSSPPAVRGARRSGRSGRDPAAPGGRGLAPIGSVAAARRGATA